MACNVNTFVRDTRKRERERERERGRERERSKITLAYNFAVLTASSKKGLVLLKVCEFVQEAGDFLLTQVSKFLRIDQLWPFYYYFYRRCRKNIKASLIKTLSWFCLS